MYLYAVDPVLNVVIDNEQLHKYFLLFMSIPDGYNKHFILEYYRENTLK